MNNFQKYQAFNEEHRKVKRVECSITNKRKGAIGKYVCDVKCECGHTMVRMFAGWSALTCGGCGAEVYRHEAIPEIDFYYRAFASGTCDKWHAFDHIFKYVDSRKVQLERVAAIGEEYGVPKSQTFNMRQRFLEMRTPQQKEA